MQIKFGDGALVVDTGTYCGKPAVFIAPAEHPGQPGADARHEQGDLHALKDSEHVLTFPTEAQAVAVANAICTPL